MSIETLAAKNWEKIGETENVNEMASHLSNMMNDALNDIAPMKSFSNRKHYKAGLTQETKSLMSLRDLARKEIRSTPGDKWIAIQKYKTLRNRVTQQARNDVIMANGKRIDEASNENEYW